MQNKIQQQFSDQQQIIKLSLQLQNTIKYRLKLKQTQISRRQFINQLKALPSILLANNRKFEDPYNYNNLGIKWNLGCCHLFQILRMFVFLSEGQLEKVPLRVLKLILAENMGTPLTEQKRLLCVIQEMDNVLDLETNFFVSWGSKKKLTVLDHRYLCQILIEIKPEWFEIGQILFFDQRLTCMQRQIYGLTRSEYCNWIQYQKIKNEQKYKKAEIEKKQHIIKRRIKNYKQNYASQNYYQTYTIKQLEDQANKQELQNKIIGYNAHQQLILPHEAQIKNDSQKQLPQKIETVQPQLEKSEQKQHKIKKSKKSKKIIKKIDKLISKPQKQRKRTEKLKQKFTLQSSKIQQNSLQSQSIVDNEQFQQMKNIQKQQPNQILSQNQGEQEFLRKERARIFQHTMNSKLRQGKNMFKGNNQNWGVKRMGFNKFEQTYASGRKIWMEQKKKLLNQKAKKSKKS